MHNHLGVFQFITHPTLAALRTSKPPTRTNSPAAKYAQALAGWSSPTGQPPALPVEILERIIDFLHADKVLSEECHKVNTAATLTKDFMIYGTDSGIYLSRNGGRLAKLLKLPAVSQIDALETQNLLLILSGRRLLVGPLHLATSNPALFHQHLQELSSSASFFQVGDHLGKRVVCIVTSGRFSSYFKVLEAVVAPTGSRTDTNRAPAPAYTLVPYRSFYLPEHARSVHILNRTIGAVLRTSFQCVDPQSLVTFPVPVAPVQPVPGASKKCRAMFRIDDRFLLCYDRCAFFIDKAGTSSEAAFALRWEDAAKQFALAAPYLLAFTATGMHVWRINTGARAQTVHGAGMRLLCAAPRVVVKMGDGRVVSLITRCGEPSIAASVGE
ncbi:CNH domain-containing protein [Mycena pura]|uniref:CNH domain-containing protein n=1 Tax=Mycena pura TaxID=153505 RepID=A0AAD6YML1_9AGAR|nr:CNH domain-containing protein [Mycena pura]